MHPYVCVYGGGSLQRVSAQCQGSGAWRCEFTVRASEPEHTELVERYAKLPEAVKVSCAYTDTQTDTHAHHTHK